MKHSKAMLMMLLLHVGILMGTAQFVGGRLQAQTVIPLGDSMPIHPRPNTWWWNPQKPSFVSVYSQREGWKDYFFEEISNISACGSLVLIAYRFGVALRSSDASLHLANPVNEFYCGDSTVIELSLFFENGRDLNNLELRYSDQTVMNDSYLLDSIQGMRAVCLPEPIDKKGQHHSFFSWQDCRNWGMIGLNGKWLIEPKFDEPFHFENGIADVRYYGQKRKINEKGEFVE